VTGQGGSSGVGPSDLRARRLALGLSQAALAKRLGAGANTLARWEHGELAIRNATLGRRGARSPDDRVIASATPLPTGAVTFLLSDIEDSARHWEREASAMRRALSTWAIRKRSRAAGAASEFAQKGLMGALRPG
jgi:transcriptional regulator with XRE-family HTH domain